jgi:hypothetical protein
MPFLHLFSLFDDPIDDCVTELLRISLSVVLGIETRMKLLQYSGWMRKSYSSSQKLKSLVDLGFHYCLPPFPVVSGHCLPVFYSHYIKVFFYVICSSFA